MSDNKQEQEPAIRVVEVSRKYVLTLATALITSAGLVSVAYYNNRPNDTDRFYGWEGRANTASITALRKEIKSLHEHINDFNETKPLMIRRVGILEIWVEKHDADYVKHVSLMNKTEREFSLMDANLNYKINECLRRIGVGAVTY